MTVDEVVAFVREGRTRSFTCSSCGAIAEMLVPAAAISRLVAQCESCKPQSQTWIRERAERPLREAIRALDDQVRELKALVEAFDHAPAVGRAARHRRFGPAGKMALSRAIRCVGTAKGAQATGDALLDVAAIARDWAAILMVRQPANTDAA